MLNVNELEQRWKQYKIKSFIPYLVIFMSLFVIVIITFILLSGEEAQLTNPNKPLSENKIQKDKAIPTEQINSNKNQVEKVHKLTFTPSLEFIEKIQNDNIYSDNLKPKKVIPTQQIKEEKIIPIEMKEEVILPSLELVEEEKSVDIIEEQGSPINITRKTTQNDINEVIVRFNKNNNPALSLFIAKKYYDLGEYRKSYNYALITNELNNDIETSWIIFAKSLVKLNEKDQAIETLQKYIKHSKSNRASTLLDRITSGKFK